MFKKIFSLFLIMLLFILTSCTITGPNNNSNNNNNNNNNNGNDKPTVEPFSFENIFVGNELIKLSIIKDKSKSFKIEYKKVNSNIYTELDENLITDNNETIDCEILGISKGSYDIRITDDLNQTMELNDLIVSEIDRSGYTHFNATSGVGAYNNDGTLKDNVIILYLTNENKNTLTANFNGNVYTGIADILANVSKSTNPVLIRVKGKITTNQWNYKKVEPRLADNSNLKSDHFENTFSNEYGENIENLPLKLSDKKEGITYNYKTTKTGIVKVNNGSTSKSTTTYSKSVYPNITGKKVYDDDSSFNCLTIKNAKNVTIEGLGTDAEFFQWGLSFSDSESIEVRNITFTDYQEDACAFYGSDETKHSRFFVYQCTFNKGKNNWDLTGEQDKPNGDGAVDVNKVSNVTVSYTRFNETHKTGLVASSDSSNAKDITFHHNYYYKVQSRMPLARNANIHIYNNYYDDCGTCLSIRSNGYVFSEANYFYSCSAAHTVSGGVIKSYNDIFDSSSKIQSVKVTSRTQTVTNSCKQNGKDYSKFDIDSTIFYYDSINKKSNVNLLVEANKLKDLLNYYSGVKNKYNQFPLTNSDEKNQSIWNKIYNIDIEEEPNTNENKKLVYDTSSLVVGTKVESGTVKAGDFTIHHDFDIALSGDNVIIKNLGSDFESKRGLIEFTNYVNTKLSIDFCSRNSTATDRYLIIYDEAGNILYTSNPANGSERSIFTFIIEKNKTYYIGSNSGLTIYNIH